MKVALINSVCGFGSTGRIVVDQYNNLIENGHDALIAYGRKAGDETINAYKMGNRLTTLISVAETRLFDSHGLNNRAATRVLIKKLDAFNPDILHLHNLHGYYINYPMLFEYIKAKALPVVWNLHDCWSLTGHCSHFEYVGCEKWQSGCVKCPQKTEYPASFCLDRCRKNYILKKAVFNLPNRMTLVVPSKWLAGVVKQSFLGEKKTTVIPTSIDLDLFAPAASDLRQSLGLTDKFVVLGAASVFSERKGYDDFIKLSKTLPDDVQLVLLGLDRSKLSGLPSNVTGIGRVGSAREMAEYYTMADVFLNPTKEDTFPTVNLESLACGTPVITYRSGGSGDMLNKSCGVIVARDDIDGLKSAILAMKKAPLKKEACISQVKKYDRNAQRGAYLNVYNELLN